MEVRFSRVVWMVGNWIGATDTHAGKLNAFPAEIADWAHAEIAEMQCGDCLLPIAYCLLGILAVSSKLIRF